MRIDKLDDGRLIHMEIERDDRVLPCPFCGGTDLELQNTHTASYWIECPCGVEVSGRAYGTNTPSNKLAMRHHRMAKQSALAAWNRRAA